MAAMPSTHASSAGSSGRVSIARSKSSAMASTLRIRLSFASPALGLPLLGAAALEVHELGAFALERREVFVGLDAGLVALGVRGLEIRGQGRGRRIELLDALLSAGLVVGHGVSRWVDGPARSRAGGDR